ncbi:hypothetical protein BJ742DRAFT_307796 [Cladochytrium replicatum]|nr:hypothetical protein BJ742DRAFT_307796 [Cladochytrium replicatum]
MNEQAAQLIKMFGLFNFNRKGEKSDDLGLGAQVAAVPVAPVHEDVEKTAAQVHEPVLVVSDDAAGQKRRLRQYAVAAISAGAFGSFFYTARQHWTGAAKVPLDALLADPAKAAANPKLVSYLYAGRALTMSTSLVASAALCIGAGVSAYMDVATFKEFSIKFRAFTVRTFPGLVGKFSQEDGETAYRDDPFIMADIARKDQSVKDFLKELRDELKKEPEFNQNPDPNDPNVTGKEKTYGIVKGEVKKVLGSWAS